jgi:uncharacterized protein with PIN domain
MVGFVQRQFTGAIVRLWILAVLIRNNLPKSSTNLVSTLTRLNVHDLSHVDFRTLNMMSRCRSCKSIVSQKDGHKYNENVAKTVYFRTFGRKKTFCVCEKMARTHVQDSFQGKLRSTHSIIFIFL